MTKQLHLHGIRPSQALKISLRPKLSTLLKLVLLSTCATLLLLQVSAAPSAKAASNDGRVEWNELFHDQTELFDDSPEPMAYSKVHLRLRALKNDLTSAAIKYFDSDTQTWKFASMIKEIESAQKAPTSRYEYWQGEIPTGTGKSTYRFCLKDNDTVTWYNALGPSQAESELNDFTLIPDFKTPDWLKNAIIYQIFVDRFCNGDPANDVKSGEYTYEGKPTVQRAWGQSPLVSATESPSMTFYGGDLSGISSKLHYITDTVGANVIYLGPIFTSPSNHKYDTSDYDTVDKHFGTMQELQNLAAKLHSAHARLLLDGVFNHTGDTHFWFNKYNRQQSRPGAFQSLSSPYKNFYTFSRWPKEYATFLDVKELPKLNFNSAQLRAKIYAAPDSVAQKYLQPPFNIDGWRLDAPQYVDGALYQGSDNENHIIWQEFRDAVKKVSPHCAILGEFWGDASAWTTGGEWDSATNFEGFTKPVSEWITGKTYGGENSSMSVSEFDNWLRVTRAHYPVNVQQCLSNHLSNHDIQRFAERSGGEPLKTALALCFQMTYPGAPTIYYGDEYGMRGAGDPDDRRCFDWSKASLENDLVALTNKLTTLRKRYSCLRTGSFMTLKCDDTNNVYCYGRCDKQGRIAIALNNDDFEHEIQIPIEQLDALNGTFRDALSDKIYESRNGAVAAKIAGHRALILVNEK